MDNRELRNLALRTLNALSKSKATLLYDAYVAQMGEQGVGNAQANLGLQLLDVDLKDGKLQVADLPPTAEAGGFGAEPGDPAETKA